MFPVLDSQQFSVLPGLASTPPPPFSDSTHANLGGAISEESATASGIRLFTKNFWLLCSCCAVLETVIYNTAICTMRDSLFFVWNLNWVFFGFYAKVKAIVKGFQAMMT